ncbi:MAG: hypothetical protein JW754_00855 [Candidatus Aenigmarchaeota archaeon]|nr:hypothetical protein [Candidatus Aenigmarchaeota archaeon]
MYKGRDRDFTVVSARKEKSIYNFSWENVPREVRVPAGSGENLIGRLVKYISKRKKQE